MKNTSAANNTNNLQGDEGTLFSRFAERLVRVVRRAVNTTPEIVEDACSFAWAQLVRCQPRRETIFNWLCTVAIREAIRLDRAERRLVTLDEVTEPIAPVDAFEQWEDVTEAMDFLMRMPDRKRRIYLLHALGYTYAQIAELEGATLKTIDRQLARARDLVRIMKIEDQLRDGGGGEK